jgi:hypothetical protein
LAGGAAVHVLGGAARAHDRVLVDVRGQRQLDEDPVDPGVGVQLADQVEQLAFRDRGVGAVVDRAHPDLLREAALVADVDLGGRVLADEDGGQARLAAVLGNEGGDVDPDPLARRRGDRFAVDNPRRHDYRLRIGA